MGKEVLGRPVYTVSFFGSKNVTPTPSLERRLEALIFELLDKGYYVEFLVGRSNAFDLFVASVIQRCRQSTPSDRSTLVWVCHDPAGELPITKDITVDDYNQIQLYRSPLPGTAKQIRHYRDLDMLSRSCLAVFCCGRITRPRKLLRYAKASGVPTVVLY